MKTQKIPNKSHSYRLGTIASCILMITFCTTYFSSCGFRVEKNPDGTNAPGNASDSAPASAPGSAPIRILGYSNLRTQVFVPHCITCHGKKGGVNLETYASTFAALSRIKKEVLDEKSMPPSGPLGESDQTLIRLWIEAGGPENDTDIPLQQVKGPSAAPSPEPSSLPNPNPSGTPVKVTYATVRDQIFKSQCLRCHDTESGHPKAGIALNTYADVMKSIAKIQEQALIKKSMPPRKSLSTEDQELLQSWIDQGEPEGETQ